MSYMFVLHPVAAIMAMKYFAWVNTHYYYPVSPLHHYEHYDGDHYLLKRSATDKLASLRNIFGKGKFWKIFMTRSVQFLFSGPQWTR